MTEPSESRGDPLDTYLVLAAALEDPTRRTAAIQRLRFLVASTLEALRGGTPVAAALDPCIGEMARLAMALGFDAPPVQRARYVRGEASEIEPNVGNTGEPDDWILFRRSRSEVVRALTYRVNSLSNAPASEVTVSEDLSEDWTRRGLAPVMKPHPEPTVAAALNQWLRAIDRLPSRAQTDSVCRPARSSMEARVLEALEAAEPGVFVPEARLPGKNPRDTVRKLRGRGYGIETPHDGRQRGADVPEDAIGYRLRR